MPIALVFNRRPKALEESPAFAHVAERFRRAGDLQRAVSLCRDGLRLFPEHVSARVTLGLALLDLGEHSAARAELRQALERAPDNLAAIRGMAALHDHGESDLVHQDWIDAHVDVEEEPTAPMETVATTMPPEPAPIASASFAIEDYLDDVPELDEPLAPALEPEDTQPRLNGRVVALERFLGQVRTRRLVVGDR